MRLLLNILICAVAVPIDFGFLIWSTVKLTKAGFGIVNAFKYSLNR